MSVSFNGVDLPAAFTTAGATVGKIFTCTATTTSFGTWSFSFPAGLFANAPNVQVTAVSADTTIANTATATVTAGATTTSGTSGTVVLPAVVQALGGLPVKAAGAGIVVNVLAIGP